MNIADQGEVKGGRKKESKLILITQNPAMIAFSHKIKLVAYSKATVLPHFDFILPDQANHRIKTIRA